MRPKKTDTPAEEKILTVASDLFFRQGYHQTGTNQIIRDAGVSKATFYAHFPSKEDLAIAYVRTSATAAITVTKDRLEKAPDPFQRYLSFASSIHAHIIATNYRGCSFANIAREFPGKDSRIRREVVKFELQYKGTLLQTVKLLLESDPKYRALPLTAETITDRYYLLLEGAINASANFYDDWPFEVVNRAIQDLVKS